MLSNLAAQESPAREINEQTMNEIVAYMKHQFDPRRLVILERYKYWSGMQRKPGEIVPELAFCKTTVCAICDSRGSRSRI